ncbi:MAG TPA: serine/threonine-protein kinase [Gemmatimonadales bacterium]
MDALVDRLKMALGTAYELGAELGRGGMGAVYRATDLRLRRDVAIKVLPPELGLSADYRARFVREAQLAAGLSHPNIVPIYDVGEREPITWFVMAMVDGESLRAKVEREGPQPLSVVRRVLQETAQALAYAHARGVVHRDIKPDNILLDRGSGRPLVTDFGIAKALTADTELTQPGEVIGTARYMAPEQALAEGTADGRVDMYALGLVGYFMLTGKHLIKGGSLPAVIAEHIRGVKVDIATSDRRLPKALVTALERCLQADPAARYARMEEFSEALRELGGDLPDVPGPVRKLFRETERAFTTATLTGMALGVIGVERVPLAFVMFMSAFVVGAWVIAIEQASRRGVTWSMIRRSLYVERARRVEEVREQGSQIPGWLGMGTILSLALGALLMIDHPGRLAVDTLLLYGGMFGSLLAARSFGLSTAQRQFLSGDKTNVRRRMLLLVGGGAVVGAATSLVSVGAKFNLKKILVVVGVVGAFIGVLMLVIGRLIERSRKDAIENAGEWRMGRAFDAAGSWLFGRFERTGWRIRFVRDRPTAVADEAGVSVAERALKRVKDVARRATGDRTAAGEAVQLAEDLVREFYRAARDLKPVTSRLARLGEGVMATKGGALETEMEGAERESVTLRGQLRDYLSMIDALGTGLAAAAASADTSQLDIALARARELSSGVRRLTS